MQERESIIFEENNWLRNTNRTSNAFASYRTKSADDEHDAESMDSGHVRAGLNFTGRRNPEKFSSITSHDSGRLALTHKNSDRPGGFGFNTMQSMDSAAGSGANLRQSTMIEQEKKALLKIKERQKRELEMMLEQEVRMQEINERNAKKRQLQLEKEERRRAELALRAQQ